MKNEFISRLWMCLLGIFLISLSTWAVFYVDQIQYRISVFAIVGAIIAAITSVMTVTINNAKAKERELELIIVKEKQKAFEHFYNAYFVTMKNLKKGKSNKVSEKVINEMMEFKRGLMNWGSEELIKNYLEFDSKLIKSEKEGNKFSILVDGDKFLKDLRREMGFNDSNDINIMSIILSAEAREELRGNSF